MSVENISYKGPLCDTLGFRQHGNNCAPDTILQVLMFTDGLKQITQPTLYNITHRELVARTRAVFPPEQHAFMIRYFKLIQERFQNHYDALQCERDFREGCESLVHALASPPSCPLLTQKHTRSPELANASKIALKLGDESPIGMRYARVEEVLPHLLQWFRVPYRMTYKYDPDITRAVLLTTGDYTHGNAHGAPIGHLCAVLRCGSRWYFYTNSDGLYPVDDIVFPFTDDMWMVYYNRRVRFARHAGDRVIGVWVGKRELRTPKAIGLIADSEGKPYPKALIQNIGDAIYISKRPLADRLPEAEIDEILGKVSTIVGKYLPEASATNTRKGFRTLAKTYGKRSTHRHKRILNIGDTVVSVFHPDSDNATSKKSKTKSHTRKRHRGGYTPTPRNLHYLRLWKKHKSIGFTMRSSLKAKGLLPRADGTYRVSDKYNPR